MEQSPISTLQQEQNSTIANRRERYISYIEKYPLYSMLMVLNDYEKEENYEECCIIRDALQAYVAKYSRKFPKGLILPKSMAEYESKNYQDIIAANNITIDAKLAKEKATIIKLNLPIDNGINM